MKLEITGIMFRVHMSHDESGALFSFTLEKMEDVAKLYALRDCSAGEYPEGLYRRVFDAWDYNIEIGRHDDLGVDFTRPEEPDNWKLLTIEGVQVVVDSPHLHGYIGLTPAGRLWGQSNLTFDTKTVSAEMKGALNQILKIAKGVL